MESRSFKRRTLSAAVFLVLGLVVLVAGPAAGAASLFAPAQNYGVGKAPRSVAVEDFNGDGKADLATANSTSNNVSVLLNNGDGTYGTKADYGVGYYPVSVAVGDFDGSGKADLAVTNAGSSNDVSVLLNHGDGTFGDRADYEVGIFPLSVTVGDFNGDGKADLATADCSSPISNNVSVLLNNGDGTYGTKADYGAGRCPRSVTVGDFDGDGKADLAAANWDSNNVSVLLNNGDGTGTFETKVDYPTGLVPTSVAVGDFDEDGKADLAAANENSDSVSVLLNNGDGTFGTKTDYGVRSSPRSVTVGDFDGDGKADLAAANENSDSVSVLLNNGGGTFKEKVDYPVGDHPSSVTVGDFDGDGREDLAAANENSNNVSVLLNTAPPQVSSASPTSGEQGQSVTLTVNGAAFAKGAKVELSQTAVDLKASSVSVDSTTRLTAQVSIPSWGPTGKYDLVITNPGGQQVALPEGFEITAAPPPPPAPAPQISGIDPASGEQGNTISLGVSGSEFQDGASVNLVQGSMSLGSSSVTFDSSGRLNAQLSIPSGAPTGSYDVVVTNPDGQKATNTGAFNVTAAPGPPPAAAPVISSVNPKSSLRGKTITLRVSGSDLQDGAKVTLNRGFLDLRTSSVTVDSSGSSLTAKVRIPARVPAGRYDVAITNPDGQKTALSGGFKIRRG